MAVCKSSIKRALCLAAACFLAYYNEVLPPQLQPPSVQHACLQPYLIVQVCEAVLTDCPCSRAAGSNSMQQLHDVVGTSATPAAFVHCMQGHAFIPVSALHCSISSIEAAFVLQPWSANCIISLSVHALQNRQWGRLIWSALLHADEVRLCWHAQYVLWHPAASSDSSDSRLTRACFRLVHVKLQCRSFLVPIQQPAHCSARCVVLAVPPVCLVMREPLHNCIQHACILALGLSCSGALDLQHGVIPVQGERDMKQGCYAATV